MDNAWELLVSNLVGELIEETSYRQYAFDFDLKKSIAGGKILSLPPEKLRLFILAALDWLEPEQVTTYARISALCLQKSMLDLLRRRLPFTENDLVHLLNWSLRENPLQRERGISQMVKTLDYYFKEQPCPEVIQERILKLIALIKMGYFPTPEYLRLQTKLENMLKISEPELPLAAGEYWADEIIREIMLFDVQQRNLWVTLFLACVQVTGSSPSEKWRKQAAKNIEALGPEYFKQSVLGWFELVNKTGDQASGREVIRDINADVLRGLVWMCAGREDREMARALNALAMATYRKLPGIGPRCLKVANACVWALGNMPGTEGVAQLALLKARVKIIPAQKAIETALRTTASRLNLPPEELEEMSVPCYGLEEVGRGRELLGDTLAELVVEGSEVKLHWSSLDGKKLTTAPKAVKADFAETLKELQQAKKDIEKMLPAQASRIENLYLEEKCWKLAVWRERYLDHPLMGTLARRLIWKFSRGDKAVSGIGWQGHITDCRGQVLDWLDDDVCVTLWHPISASVELVLAWREWLEQHQVRQPFKQAHREIYVLTDAERQTEVYSNRFSAHILKQHQFNALCGLRGWKNKLRLMVDDVYPPAMRFLPHWNLRAEFWVEGAGDDYGTHTNQSGTYYYVATDQVRFYTLDAQENRAHAGGGGYKTYWGQARPQSLPLESIPPLVFSEIMRDVDLFVGVASVGNDPNWADSGREPHFAAYWESYAFGELSLTAKTRQQVLEKLVPRLKIGPRCRFEDRFLVVKGDIRTYKIHLGSGNILMCPNDQYLCIVPLHSASQFGPDRLFLPFEGDQTLSIILSKAFLLADDKKITDPTILRQINA